MWESLHSAQQLGMGRQLERPGRGSVPLPQASEVWFLWVQSLGPLALPRSPAGCWTVAPGAAGGVTKEDLSVLRESRAPKHTASPATIIQAEGTSLPIMLYFNVRILIILVMFEDWGCSCPALWGGKCYELAQREKGVPRGGGRKRLARRVCDR